MNKVDEKHSTTMNNVLNWNACKQDGMNRERNMIVNKEVDKSLSDLSCEGAVGYDYDYKKPSYKSYTNEPLEKLEVLMSANSLNANNKKCLLTNNSLYPAKSSTSDYCVDWINKFHPTLTKNEINKDNLNENNNNNDDNDNTNDNSNCSNKELNENVQPVSPEKTSLNDCYREDGTLDPSKVVIEYKKYESELQMQDIMRLIQAELSEPYSIYTYRYFINNWPNLCFLAAHGNEYVGAIVCKLDFDMDVIGGYIAMLAVKKEYRKMKIGTNLVEKAIEEMLANDVEEVVLETEMKNIPALRLYENLGFVRDKRLFRYYLNGVDALRLKLWFR